MTGWKRTIIAAVLTGAGVVVPCTALYIVGSRAAREQATRLADRPIEQATREAEHLARQIGLRLESLRESESRRPIRDYFGDRPLPVGDCTIAQPFGSPLAEGPSDPLIWAHFQIDDVGLVTLPTIPDSAGASSADAIQQAILNELECASSEHLAALRKPEGAGSERQVPSAQGVITVGPFSWHTSSIQEAPALIALREVQTPAAVLTQGFVVPVSRLSSLLAGSIQPATIRPGEPEDRSAVRVGLQGDAWSVEVDATEALSVASGEAARLERRFLRTFWIGACAALLAGFAVVILVHQSERTAMERVRFAAAAAHELRTPLAGLELYGEMLSDESGDPSRRQIYGRRVAQEAQRLGRVVSNVMGFSRLQREGLRVAPCASDLEATVRESLERLRPMLEANGARLALRVDDELSGAWIDSDAVQQILQNLLENASKFSREADDRTIDVVLSMAEDHPTLAVRDHGPGVDAAIRRNLFRPFCRDSRPDSPAGLGIGLALVRSLAEAQGAKVAHSRPRDGGAEFTVRFRRAA